MNSKRTIMSNIELIMNPSIAPVYIGVNNAVVPILTITFNDFCMNLFNIINSSFEIIGKIISGLATIFIFTYHFIDIIIDTSFNQLATIIGISSCKLKIASAFATIVVYLILKHSVDYEVHKDNIEEFNALEAKLTMLRVSHRGLENKNKTFEQDIYKLKMELNKNIMDTNNKMNAINKKMKKLEKELNDFYGI